MNAFGVLLKKELMTYFLSPVSSILAVFFAVTMGLNFWMACRLMMDGLDHYALIGALFGESIFFWINVLIVIPILTMRLFAEEKRLGTYETLMTAPITDAAVVWAKYLAALCMYAVLWLPTLLYLYILRRFLDVSAPLDPGAVIGAYLGAFCIGAFFTAIGLYASVTTNNQTAAAMKTFAALFVIFGLGFMPYFVSAETTAEWLKRGSAVQHMIDFSRGIIDTRPLVLYATATLWVLFAAVRKTGARQWT